jgi:hypothetical protein
VTPPTGQFTLMPLSQMQTWAPDAADDLVKKQHHNPQTKPETQILKTET